jgi:hypothetical protein
MTNIVDLLVKYNQSGATHQNGNSIITQQINYINALKIYINTVNDAVNKSCITDSASKSLNDLSGNCIQSNGSDCPSLCTNLSTQYNEIKSGGTKYINFGGDFSVSQTPDNEYGNVIANSETIMKLRNELDLKLKDLNGTPDSLFQEYEDKYNYELMMNITWSILATSIIYFVFVKL